MYISSENRLSDPSTIREFLLSHPFGTLVSIGPQSEPFATHLPFSVAFDANGDIFRLRTHLSRANPHAKALAESSEREILAIFQGAHGYISPAWYESPSDSVPTWNYSAAHVRGKVRILERNDDLVCILQELVTQHEANRGTGWKYDPTHSYQADLLKWIIGLEIEVTSVECSLKFSQSRSLHDRVRIIQELQLTSVAQDAWLAEQMSHYAYPKPAPK